MHLDSSTTWRLGKIVPEKFSVKYHDAYKYLTVGLIYLVVAACQIISILKADVNLNLASCLLSSAAIKYGLGPSILLVLGGSMGEIGDPMFKMGLGTQGSPRRA